MNTPPKRRLIALRRTTSRAALFFAGIFGVLFLVSCTSESTSPDNRPPVLVSLTAEPEAVGVGEVCTITADATDPDGDPLSYEWSAGLGHLTGGGNKVFYTAASCCLGGNAVLLTVKDGKGGEVRGQVLVNVSQ